jgi:hypothetical protein
MVVIVFVVFLFGLVIGKVYLSCVWFELLCVSLLCWICWLVSVSFVS